MLFEIASLRESEAATRKVAHERFLACMNSEVVKKLVLIAHGEATRSFMLIWAIVALKYTVFLLHFLVPFEAVVGEFRALWGFKGWKRVDGHELVAAENPNNVIWFHSRMSLKKRYRKDP